MTKYFRKKIQNFFINFLTSLYWFEIGTHKSHFLSFRLFAKKREKKEWEKIISMRDISSTMWLISCLYVSST